MAFLDKLKAKASELGLDEKAALAKEKAAAAADANRDKIAGAVDKAAGVVNEKTDGKYADKVAKAQDAAKTGVDKVAAQGGSTDPLDSGDFATSAVATEKAYDDDLAAGGSAGAADGGRYSSDFIGDADTSAGQDDVAPTAAAYGDTESAEQRTVGQDGLRTADDQNNGESAVERAIGADAPSSSLDPNTSFEDAGARDVQNADVDNAPVTDPEINEIRRVGETPRD